MALLHRGHLLPFNELASGSTCEGQPMWWLLTPLERCHWQASIFPCVQLLWVIKPQQTRNLKKKKIQVADFGGVGQWIPFVSKKWQISGAKDPTENLIKPLTRNDGLEWEATCYFQMNCWVGCGGQRDIPVGHRQQRRWSQCLGEGALAPRFPCHAQAGLWVNGHVGDPGNVELMWHRNTFYQNTPHSDHENNLAQYFLVHLSYVLTHDCLQHSEYLII